METALWIIVGIAIVVGIVFLVRQGLKEQARRLENLKSKVTEDGFTVAKQIIGINNLYIFAVDDTAKKIRIVTEQSSRTLS
jgi:hypothetical protein